MASRRRLAEMADIVLRSHLARKQANEQAEAIKQRQIELSEQGARQRALDELIKNPLALRRWMEQNPGQQLNGVDPSAFLPTHEDAVNEVRGMIGKAKSLNDLVDPDAAYHSHPGARAHAEGEEDLFTRDFLTRQEQLKSNVQPVAQKFMNEGVQSERYVNPWQASAPVATERTGQQEGERNLASFMANEGSPTRVARGISIANQTESGTRGEKVKTAGAEAAARTAADLGQRIKFGPQLLEQEIAKARAMVGIEADKARMGARATFLQGLQDNTTKALPRLYELEMLWSKAEPLIKDMNLTNLVPGGMGATALDKIVPYAMQPAEVRMYFQKLESTLPWLARAAGDVGNLAVQEQLQQKFSAPTAIDAMEGTGLAKLQEMQAITIAMPRIAQIDPRMDPGQAVNEMERIIAEVRQSLQGRRGQQVTAPGQAPAGLPGAPPTRLKVGPDGRIQ